MVRTAPFVLLATTTPKKEKAMPKPAAKISSQDTVKSQELLAKTGFFEITGMRALVKNGRKFHEASVNAKHPERGSWGHTSDVLHLKTEDGRVYALYAPGQHPGKHHPALKEIVHNLAHLDKRSKLVDDHGEIYLPLSSVAAMVQDLVRHCMPNESPAEEAA